LTGRDRDIETTYKNDPNMWKNATNIFWKVRDVIESPKFQKGIENSSEKIKDFISNNEKLIDAVAREDIKASSKKPSDYSEKYTSGSAKDVASFRKSLEQSVNQYYNLEARAQALESVGKKQYAVNKDFMEADLTDLVPKGKPLSKYPESERGYWYALYKFYKKKENTIPNY
jgi:hypothetical protein